jgi:hypothetical protein
MANAPIDAVRDRRLQIAQEIETLRDEDEQLAIAELALQRLLGRRDGSALAERTPGQAKRQPGREIGAPRSQREAVVEILRLSPEPWIKSGDLVDYARRLWGMDLPEKSLRPLLSVMKREGAILRQRRLIASTQRVSHSRDPGGR